MGALWVSTTRANTSTSTEAALARSSARAQASTVAPEVRTSSIRTTRRPWISDCAVGGDLECALHVAGALRPRQADLLLGRPDAPQRLRCHLDAALPFDRPAPARRTGCSGGSSRAASAAAPEPARRPRRAIRARRAPSSGPSRAPDRCGPGISAHAPACARRRHSAPRRGRAHRPADWRSPPSTTVRARDRRQRECRAADNKAAR